MDLDKSKGANNFLTYGNIVGLIAVAAYFHNQNKILKEEFSKLTDRVNRHTGDFKSVSRDNESKGDAIIKINSKLSDIELEIKKLMLNFNVLDKREEGIKSNPLNNENRKYRNIDSAIDKIERKKRVSSSKRLNGPFDKEVRPVDTFESKSEQDILNEI